MTAAELILLLSAIPGNTQIVSSGPDCGGYDCEIGSNILAYKRGGEFFIGHDGYEG